MAASNKKQQARLKRKRSIRKKLSGTPERPRLTVFRSAKHIYAQIIDDVAGRTLVFASSVDKQVKGSLGSGGPMKKSDVANHVGKVIAERALKSGIKTVVFDRNGFLYHGRIKAVSEGAREGGLDF
ncbi:MAG: 50S ribosomal protein L18 [Desulfobacterales bacterium]